jgi:radical SAM superfamily enzyme YgiQ (UPF0313 family)
MRDCWQTSYGFYDVVFVNPPHHSPDYYSPIGIGMLSVLVRERGYRTVTLDFQKYVVTKAIPWPQNFFETAIKWVENTSAKIYGFTSMNVGLPWAIRLARLVRQYHPSSTIIFGGPHATLLSKELLETFTEIDIIVLNEGERVIIPLIEALLPRDNARLRSVPNLLIREEDGRLHKTPAMGLTNDLDTLPLLDLDLDLLSQVEMVSVEAGRGCPYSCSFCSSHSIWTRKPRFKSPERLVSEAARYVETAPQGLCISYEHDDFLANGPLFKRFAAHKIRSGKQFKYGITARLNHITTEVRTLLAASGCVSIFMGIETGSDQLQISSAKFLKLQDVLPRIQALLDCGIHVSTNFILGFPDETWHDVYRSIELMLAVSWLGATVNISIMCPEPGSSLFNSIPREEHVVLLESTYVEELGRGGIRVQQLTEVERFHLTTIRNRNFEIEEVARLARSLQLLMAEFPLSTYNLRQRLGNVELLVQHILEYQLCSGMRITPATAFNFFCRILGNDPTGRSLEFLLYETCRAALKYGDASATHLSVFGSDMPDAYHKAFRNIEVAIAQ